MANENTLTHVMVGYATVASCKLSMSSVSEQAFFNGLQFQKL